MTFYSFFQHLHSGFRYLVLIFIVLAALGALIGLISKKPYTEANRKLSLFGLIAAHTQLLIGIVLYIASPFVKFNSTTMKDPLTRFFTVEHWVMMVIAIVLITIGHSKSKKATTNEGKQKAIFVFYILGLIVISTGIILIPRG